MSSSVAGASGVTRDADNIIYGSVVAMIWRGFGFINKVLHSYIWVQFRVQWFEIE